jgi:hypothetical protein
MEHVANFLEEIFTPNADSNLHHHFCPTDRSPGLPAAVQVELPAAPRTEPFFSDGTQATPIAIRPSASPANGLDPNWIPFDADEAGNIVPPARVRIHVQFRPKATRTCFPASP